MQIWLKLGWLSPTVGPGGHREGGGGRRVAQCTPHRDPRYRTNKLFTPTVWTGRPRMPSALAPHTDLFFHLFFGNQEYSNIGILDYDVSLSLRIFWVSCIFIYQPLKQKKLWKNTIFFFQIFHIYHNKQIQNIFQMTFCSNFHGILCICKNKWNIFDKYILNFVLFLIRAIKTRSVCFGLNDFLHF